VTLTLVLMGLGGVLVGGVLSMRAQGAPTPAVVLVGLLAVLALTGGVLQLVG
jgi:hypothetical protein